MLEEEKFVKVGPWICQKLFYVFWPFAKQNQAEFWPRFQRLLKPLLWTKGVEWVKVLNALGPLCPWQCFFYVSKMSSCLSTEMIHPEKHSFRKRHVTQQANYRLAYIGFGHSKYSGWWGGQGDRLGMLHRSWRSVSVSCPVSSSPLKVLIARHCHEMP